MSPIQEGLCAETSSVIVGAPHACLCESRSCRSTFVQCALQETSSLPAVTEPHTPDDAAAPRKRRQAQAQTQTQTQAQAQAQQAHAQSGSDSLTGGGVVVLDVVYVVLIHTRLV